MLGFYQKIRRNLLVNQKLKRYLLYAVGEIILVVIGILIAVQVNNWNRQQKEKDIEIALLQQMEKDLTTCLEDINYNIIVTEKGIKSAEMLLSYMDTNQPYEDSLAAHFASSFTWTRLMINSIAYETIKSNGIDIISNVDLRNKIVNLFETRLEFLRQLENITLEYVETMRREEAVNYFKSFNKDFGLIDDYDSGKSVPKNYAQLRKNENFKYHLETFLNLRKILQTMGNRPMQNEIVDLKESIRQELNK